MMQSLIFLLLSLITLGAAVVVVTHKNLFISALFLILAFVGVAGLYVMLEAPFLATVQILIYVGAIAILIIFAIMLTRHLVDGDIAPRNRQWFWAALGAGALFVVLSVILVRVNWPIVQKAVPGDMITILGGDLVGRYLVPFEIASVLLLVGLVGSIIIDREKE